MSTQRGNKKSDLHVKLGKGTDCFRNSDECHGGVINVDQVFVERRDSLVRDLDLTVRRQEGEVVVVAGTQQQDVQFCLLAVQERHRMCTQLSDSWLLLDVFGKTSLKRGFVVTQIHLISNSKHITAHPKTVSTYFSKVIPIMKILHAFFDTCISLFSLTMLSN